MAIDSEILTLLHCYTTISPRSLYCAWELVKLAFVATLDHKPLSLLLKKSMYYVVLKCFVCAFFRSNKFFSDLHFAILPRRIDCIL